MNVTCEFGISGASRLTCRCVRIFKCTNHLRVHCTCTMHPSPLLHTAPSRPCQGAPCTEFGVAGSKFTFTGGPHVKTASSPLARAAGTPLERHPQWILSWCSTHVTCEFGISGAPRLTCRAAKIFGRPSRGGTCHVPRAADRPATGTTVVPAFRRVDRCHPGPDRTSRSGAIPGNA